MGYFDFVKQSDFIVCIDSDGCAMDTMEVKHRECFGPQWIYTYGLEDKFDECMKLWLDINLYSITRGINRFKGLAMALVEMEKRGCHFEGLDEFAANKMLAFFAGAAYALDGKTVMINDTTYLFARRVDFMDGSLQNFIQSIPKK